MTDDDLLRRAVLDVLGTRAMTHEAIADEIISQGLLAEDDDRNDNDAPDRDDLVDEIGEALMEDLGFAEVTGGIIHLLAVLDGTTWTVPVDAADAAEGFVRASPYLTPLVWAYIDDPAPLLDADGTEIGHIEVDGFWLDDYDIDVFVGPDGWLDHLAGGWAAVSLEDDGLRWAPLAAPPEATAEQRAATATGFERAVASYRERDAEMAEVLGDAPRPEGLDFVSHVNVVLEAVRADRDAFIHQPPPPIPALLRASGLELDRHHVAAAGFDWAALRAWQIGNRARQVHDLDDERADAYVALFRAWEDWVGDRPGPIDREAAHHVPPPPGLAAHLDDGEIAGAFWNGIARDETTLEELGAFADALGRTLDSAAPEPRPIGLTWLRSRVLDLTGRGADALTALDAAIDSSCTHRPALVDLAGYRSDRGDAVGTLRLLERAGASLDAHEPDDDVDAATRRAMSLLDEVSPYALHQPRATARRNDPCPCGSGRKYKQCHLGLERHSLDARAEWLYHKAERFMGRDGDDPVHDLTRVFASPGDMPDAHDALCGSQLVVDLALHDDGGFEEFLATRGELLPDDEAILAAQWALVDRGVFEVERRNGDRVELRDIGRGERITVVNVSAGGPLEPGAVLLGRPLPVGDTHRAINGLVEVPRRLVQPLLDAIDTGDATEIGHVIASTFLPPRLTNTDGEEMVFHTMRWRTSGTSAPGDALVAAGFRDDGSGTSWSLVRDSLNQRDTVIATLRLDGDTLEAEVNSDERAAGLARAVREALDDAELIADDRRTLDEARAAREDGELPAMPPVADDPETRAVMAEVVEEMERRWLDEPVPALGGRTPREAADDPIGREELDHLLRSFPAVAPGTASTMDPERLRRALGL